MLNTDVMLDTPVVQPTDVQVQPTAPIVEEPDRYEIPGFGEVTVEQLNEWKNGSMRQADYTRKTQELAEQRQKLFSAPQVEPTTLQQPVNDDLARRVQRMEIESELSRMKNQYKDFDEVAVLDKAISMIGRGIPSSAIDFEMLHRATRVVDEDAIRAKILRELGASADTSSLIGAGSTVAPTTQTVTLSPEEDRARVKLGISMEEWLQYK